METEQKEQLATDDNAELHARRIDMGDGRYLIFFTFGDEPQNDKPVDQNV